MSIYQPTELFRAEKNAAWKQRVVLALRSATVASASSLAANQAAKCKLLRRLRHPRISESEIRGLQVAERGRYQGRLLHGKCCNAAAGAFPSSALVAFDAGTVYDVKTHYMYM
ncbi:uncharacterized protein PITG_18520 [Phytophthora infestans T30-4]|uniref:Uncharacterized protein n=2 Tax=Phytophthora infestans TaxID=4787 RepID=D0NY87_PHYIT|nr:uncharacterized protein PITG_18520 [Phytophthora infestans T30-4]EEY68076.1 hypothetical protein PITG_18520 [Phytophthora infestans T30-4]|eukprot:XP_002997634.1 hypothetical protein PITG_18520 [Phytophthora infestans T30-4]